MGLSGSAAGGAWEIPTAGVWQLHAGETVLPRAAAKASGTWQKGAALSVALVGKLTFTSTPSMPPVCSNSSSAMQGQLASAVRVHMANNPTSFAR